MSHFGELLDEVCQKSPIFDKKNWNVYSLGDHKTHFILHFFLGYKAPDLNVQYEWSPIPRDSDYYFDIPYTEYYDYYNEIDYDIPPASEPSYYTEPKITPKPYQYYIPNTTTSTYSYYPIEDLFPTNLQTVADDRQDTSIIFGVPVANFGVS